MGIRVLLVDDEKDYVNSLSRQLSVRGMVVTAAFDGDTALEEVRRRRFDVIILDVMMPGRDGVETFKELKQIDPSVPVIMHTGHARIDLAVDELKNGIFDYIIKPVAIDELMEKIEMATRKRKIAEEQAK